LQGMGIQERGCSPLREGFITSDMSTLACLASGSALGMTAPRGTGALTSHNDDVGLQLNNRVYRTFRMGRGWLLKQRLSQAGGRFDEEGEERKESLEGPEQTREVRRKAECGKVVERN
jgi:hypothetical protein